MRPEEVMVRQGVSGSEQLDELQRGQDPTLSTEGMDRGLPTQFGAQGPTQVPIPDPGVRPGAVRIGEPVPEKPARQRRRSQPRNPGA